MDQVLNSQIDQEYLREIKNTLNLLLQYPDDIIAAMRLALEHICVLELGQERARVTIRYVNMGTPIFF